MRGVAIVGAGMIRFHRYPEKGIKREQINHDKEKGLKELADFHKRSSEARINVMQGLAAS